MRRWTARRIALSLVALLLLGLVGAEVAARLLGVGDFPTYDADPKVGYIPSASQQGAFLNVNRWAFNSRHMGVAREFAPSKDGVLLVGDSIVLGGNMLDQPDKLGPQLEAQTGCPTWPLSAGSWAFLNALQALELNPDFLQVGTLVIVLNSGDFGQGSRWTSDLTHPRERPLLASAYAVQRKFFPVSGNTKSLADPAAGQLWRSKLANLLNRYSGRVVFVRYPTREELQRGHALFPAEVSATVGRVQSLQLLGAPGWSRAFYRDDIHPSAEGNRALSSIIAGRVGKCA